MKNILLTQEKNGLWSLTDSDGRTNPFPCKTSQEALRRYLHVEVCDLTEAVARCLSGLDVYHNGELVRSLEILANGGVTIKYQAWQTTEYTTQKFTYNPL